MKLKLSHKTYDLDVELSEQERMKVINNILIDKIEFHEETMTVEEYFRYTWNKQTTKTCIDIIAYYLTKENRNLDVLSKTKENEMIKGSKRQVPFTSLGVNDAVQIGIVDVDDSNYS